MKIANNQENYVNVSKIGGVQRTFCIRNNENKTPLVQKRLTKDVVEFKSKLPQNKQEIAYKKLESLKKDGIVDRNIYNELLKDIKSNNKNVIRILNNIETTKITFKNNKENADNVVNKHAQIARAISYSKNNSDLRQNLLNNELKMIENVSAVYGKKLPSYIENNVSDVGFGGRKDAAKKIVRQHVAAAAGGGAFIPEPILSAGALILNEVIMTSRVGEVYGYKGLKEILTVTCGIGSGTLTSVATMPIAEKAGETLIPQLTSLILQSAASIGGSAATKVIPIVGGIVNGGIAVAATAALGKAVIDIFESLT